MTDTALRRWLLAVAVIAATAFAVVLVLQEPAQRDRLWIEVGKGLIQLVVIGVAGTGLKLLADSYQARREGAEQHAEFRVDKHRRLLAATNALRKAPILIAANQSVKTWNDQMIALVGAGFELRAIRHEIVASGFSADRAFPNADQIVEQLKAMGTYIDWVIADFAKNKKPLAERQRWAEASGISDEERARRQAVVWGEPGVAVSRRHAQAAGAGASVAVAGGLHEGLRHHTRLDDSRRAIGRGGPWWEAAGGVG